MVVVEARGRTVEYANPEAERLAGRALVGLRFPSPETLMAAPGAHAFEARGNPVARVLKGERIDREILACRRADGHQFHAEVSAAPVADASGHLHQVIVAFADVTDRIAAEEAIQQGAKMQALGQLTGGIAHDFNNLLTPVLGGLDMIRRSATDERILKLVDNALRSAERGTRLTSQLLAFSRMQRLELRPVLVAPLVAGMKTLLASTLGPSIRLAYDLDEAGPVPVLADPTQVELIVLNLAINARDAMPDGGDLTIGTRRRMIENDPDLAAGEYVELSVTDTGAGMPPDVVERAFDPFFTTKEKGKGTGLGLSMVYGVAAQAGGTARINSRPGAGTTITVLLPRIVDDEAAGDAAAVGEIRPSGGGGRTILIVDDDADVRTFVAEALRECGYRILEAPDGETGLAVAAAEPVDLMIVDFAMPGLNGADVAIDALRLRPGQKLLFMTGFADTAALDAAAPDAPVLRKPFAATQLIAAVEESLGSPSAA